MQRPRFPSSSALALCSLHFSLRGTPLASPSHRVLLCWTLCRKDQQHSSTRSFVLTYDPTRRPRSPHDSAPALSSLQFCLRATTSGLAFTQCSALSQALLVGTPTLPGLLHRPARRDAPPYQTPYLWLLMTTGSAVLRRMASDLATDKAWGLGTRKGNTSLRGSKDGILGTEDDERERVL
jgi:hypothetical protein